MTSATTRVQRPGALWAAPALIFFGIFGLAPIVIVAGLSFTTWDGLGNPEWAGLHNWRTLPSDKLVGSGLMITLTLTVLTWATQTPLALAFGAWAAGPQRIRAVVSTLFFLPLLLSTAAIALIWQALLDPTFGLPAQPRSELVRPPTPTCSGDPAPGAVAVVFVITLAVPPLPHADLPGGRPADPRVLYEAAAMDGAGTVCSSSGASRCPSCGNTVIASSVLIVVGSLTYFETVLLLTGGGPGTATRILPLHMYIKGFSAFDMGYASVIAVLLVPVGTAPVAAGGAGHRLPQDGQPARGSYDDVGRAMTTVPGPRVERPQARSVTPRPAPVHAPARARRHQQSEPARLLVAGIRAAIWLVLVWCRCTWSSYEPARLRSAYLSAGAVQPPNGDDARRLRPRLRAGVPAIPHQQPDRGVLRDHAGRRVALPAAFAITRARKSRVVRQRASPVPAGTGHPRPGGDHPDLPDRDAAAPLRLPPGGYPAHRRRFRCPCRSSCSPARCGTSPVRCTRRCSWTAQATAAVSSPGWCCPVPARGGHRADLQRSERLEQVPVPTGADPERGAGGYSPWACGSSRPSTAPTSPASWRPWCCRRSPCWPSTCSAAETAEWPGRRHRQISHH